MLSISDYIKLDGKLTKHTEARCTCLILNEFAIQMRHKVRFQKLDFAKTLVVSLLKSVRREKNFERINFPKEKFFSYKKL